MGLPVRLCIGPGGGGMGLPDDDFGGDIVPEGRAPGSATPDAAAAAGSEVSPRGGGGVGAGAGGLGAEVAGGGLGASAGGLGAAESGAALAAGAWGSVSVSTGSWRDGALGVGRTAGGRGADDSLAGGGAGAGGLGGVGASAAGAVSAGGLGGGGGFDAATLAGSTTFLGVDVSDGCKALTPASVTRRGSSAADGAASFTTLRGGAVLDDTAPAAGSAGFGSDSASSGSGSRISPSRSALRRTRSACCSTTLEEWLLTPIPNALQRSTVSLLLSPSSFASSYTRILAKSLRFALRTSRKK